MAELMVTGGGARDGQDGRPDRSADRGDRTEARDAVRARPARGSRGRARALLDTIRLAGSTARIKPLWSR